MASDENATPADLRNLLPWDPSALSILPKGEWKPTARPIATDYVVPGRGSEGHGTDQDVKALDFKPDQSGGVAGMEEKFDPEHPDFKDLNAPQPLYVSVIPGPQKAVTKSSYTRLLFDGRVAYTTAAFTPDLSNVLSFSRDESRVRIQLRVEANNYVAEAGWGSLYLFAVSHDSQFPPFQYMILAASTEPYEFIGTEPLYVTIFPLAAADNTKDNSYVLKAVTEFATTVDNNPTAG